MTTYLTPTDLEAAIALCDEHADGAKVVAGGQSLSLMLSHDLLDPPVLIDIGDVAELSGIETAEGRVSIGAAVTYAELLAHPISETFPELGEAVGAIADTQVRNLGTVGGAVCHADPALDIVPPLLCLDATVHLRSVDGGRQVPLEAFHQGFMAADLAANELVERVTFAAHADRAAGTYTKLARIAGGWPAVGVATRAQTTPDGTTFGDVRVALAAVADTAVRAPTVEGAVVDQPVDDGVIERGAARVIDDIDPLGDLAGSAAYKAHLSRVLVERGLARCAARLEGSS